MWMGTYPTFPSRLLSTGELLGEYLKKNPQLVGKSVLDRWGPEVPYLPKVWRDTEVDMTKLTATDPLLLQSAPPPSPPQQEAR